MTHTTFLVRLVAVPDGWRAWGNEARGQGGASCGA